MNKEKITLGILTYDDPNEDNTLKLLKNIKSDQCTIDIIIPDRHESNQLERKYDVILFRAGTYSKQEQLERSLQLYQKMHARSKIDTLDGLKIANDKALQTKIAYENSINIPDTNLISSLHEYKAVVSKLGFPHIIKYQFGYGGDTVFLVDNLKDAKKIIQKGFENKNKKILIQQFIKSDIPRDYRLYVFGDTVVKGVIRTAKEGEFRANIKQGGNKKTFAPSNTLKEMAIKIAKIMKMELLTVDFLLVGRKYYFLEINDSFGMKNDKRLAKKLIDFCISKSEMGKK